ncbi:hypothetical protein [Nocardioides flavescens]|uniref:Glycosyl hydrolases family 43 n=1 Tax=Nocardioides flavescens TaxID=2691959 RepID=A0A6L7EWH9_9ACTN|nr:hypothetical protein [Nocardioides flavescens]MXG88359.1 hypothetical protein [Nocardioides flavescens]
MIRWSRRLAAAALAVVGLTALQPVAPAQAASASGFYASNVVDGGQVDANNSTYVYAPDLIYFGNKYYYFACVGKSGDYIQVKSATTLAGLNGAAFKTVLQPEGGETHTCDPSVVRGDNGTWYLHYSNTPNGSTGAGVASSPTIDGTYTKISRNLLGRYTGLTAGQYGRGQTSVAQGSDGQWYMAFTNQIEPYERNSIVVLRSPDPSFANTRTEVARINPGLIGGWSAHLTFDLQNNRFVFTVPNGNNEVGLAMFDTSFNYIGRETLPMPAGAGTPGEGQALLKNAAGRVLTNTPSAPGHLVVAGATVGTRAGYPATVTGPNQYRRYAVNPIGPVPLVEAYGGGVHVAGWSFDPNDRSASLQTHVYISRTDGSGQEGTNLGPTAVDRPDVNSSQGTTGLHGFDSIVPTSLRGTVQVCIAAINIGSGDNTWFGCQNVNITG